MTAPLRRPADLSALSALASEVASTVASVGGDIALVVGHDGIIRNVAEGAGVLASAVDGWVGRPWAEVVTADTRRKVELLLQEVRAGGVARRREVNHMASSGAQVAVAYSAVQLGAQGPVLAVGRDLSAVAAIQQRFLDAQQDLERDYWQRRQSDARFRMLFQVLNDAVLLVDAHSFTVLEANNAADRLFGAAPGGLLHTSFPDRVDAASRSTLTELLSHTRKRGRAPEGRVRPDGLGSLVEVSATPFRSENQHLLLVRARAAGAPAADSAPGGEDRRLIDFVQHTPDGVVITDIAGRVLMANPAFAALCGSRPEAELRGQTLDALLGDTGGHWLDLLTRARRRGIAIQDVVAVGSGHAIAFDAVAAILADGDQECVGFSLRPQRAQPPLLPSIESELASAMVQLTGQVGRLPLGDLLSEVQIVAERHLVALALRAAGSHLPEAALALGLSVESLELRLRRHRLVPADGRVDRPLLN